MIAIAIDAMSGDFGPAVTVPASVRALSFMPDINLILLGDSLAIQSELGKLKLGDQDRIRIVAATQTVAMDEMPSSVLRGKKDSSLYRAIQLLKEGEVDACVSAGNTGALMAVGCHLLHTFEGIDRPAICVSFPRDKGQIFLLDAGANVDVPARNLHQFALMGSVLAAAILGKDDPAVALLNIGTENIKGNEQVKQTALMLQQDPMLNYRGFIEADQIFFSDFDVAVCDGFAGNIALKASEGTARFISYKLRELMSGRIMRLLLLPIFDSFRSRINPGSYNGASFLGLTKTLVKSHGSADVEAFCRAIEVARYEVKENVPQKINERLHLFL